MKHAYAPEYRTSAGQIFLGDCQFHAEGNVDAACSAHMPCCSCVPWLQHLGQHFTLQHGKLGAIVLKSEVLPRPHTWHTLMVHFYRPAAAPRPTTAKDKENKPCPTALANTSAAVAPSSVSDGPKPSAVARRKVGFATDKPDATGKVREDQCMMNCCRT